MLSSDKIAIAFDHRFSRIDGKQTSQFEVGGRIFVNNFAPTWHLFIQVVDCNFPLNTRKCEVDSSGSTENFQIPCASIFRKPSEAVSLLELR